jgi:hypothetical protein
MSEEDRDEAAELEKAMAMSLESQAPAAQPQVQAAQPSEPVPPAAAADASAGALQSIDDDDVQITGSTKKRKEAPDGSQGMMGAFFNKKAPPEKQPAVPGMLKLKVVALAFSAVTAKQLLKDGGRAASSGGGSSRSSSAKIVAAPDDGVGGQGVDALKEYTGEDVDGGQTTERARLTKANSGKAAAKSAASGKAPGLYMVNASTQRTKAATMASDIQFKTRGLVVDANNKIVLFCNNCRCQVSPKISTVHDHLLSAKHLESERKSRDVVAQEREEEIVSTYFGTSSACGSTLPLKQLIFRYFTLKTFLNAGVRISKIGQLRGPIEQGAWGLGHLASSPGLP